MEKQQLQEQERARRARRRRVVYQNATVQTPKDASCATAESPRRTAHGGSGVAGRTTNYSDANRVRAMGLEAQNRENEYIRATEERMGRERQLRQEAQRRRKAARRRKLRLARKEEKRRSSSRSGKKETAYVNYIRKHLTKMTVRPKVASSHRSKWRREGTIKTKALKPTTESSKTRSNAVRTTSRRTWTEPREPQRSASSADAGSSASSSSPRNSAGRETRHMVSLMFLRRLMPFLNQNRAQTCCVIFAHKCDGMKNSDVVSRP